MKVVSRRVAAASAVALIIVLAVLALSCGGDDDEGGDAKWFARPMENYRYPVQMFEAEIGAEGRHFAVGEFEGYGTVEYGTDPPTSGRHIGELARQGVSDLVVPNEVAVHNMEHGFVLVWYNCSAPTPLPGDACPALRNSLASVVQPAVANGKLVILSPNSTMDRRIALTAWQFMDSMDELDTDRVQSFIDTFECHYDPEGTC